MKYSDTSRILSLVFHGLIVAAFGALGIYYAFFVVPFYFTNYANDYSSHQYGLYLYLELAVIGITICACGVYGLLNAIKALKDKRNDEPVIKSFVAFLCAGAAAAVFFFLNGTLLFQLLTEGGTKNVGFVIVVCILLAIGLLIAVNIPMVKLFDGKDNTFLVGCFVGTAAIALLASAASMFSAYVGSKIHGVDSNYKSTNLALGLISLAFAVVGLLTLASSIVTLKGKKQGGKLTNLGENLTISTVIVLGFALISNGIIDIVFRDEKIHFLNVDRTATDYSFPVVSIILGGLLLLGGVSMIFIINDKTGDSKLKKIFIGK